MFEWENKPYLTFNGLLRIARTVVLDFVQKQQYLKEEEYDWVSELPGRVMMKWAGQYWIGRHENYSVDRSAEWLSAFVSVWLQTASSEEPVMPDLRPLLNKFESLLGTVPATQRAQILTVHSLYNDIMASECQSSNHETVYQDNKFLFDDCRIESMVFKVLAGCEWPWSADDCAHAYEGYEERKFDKQGLSLPRSLEVAMMAYISDKYRENRQEDVFRSWARRALLESAGEENWQNHIRGIQEEGHTVDLGVFLI